ncbi:MULTISPECIES: YveK family protein [Brevibacillus]|jgi:capsular polysaccharide biosynthesis protein|uniref:Putative capsular polysaccharide biosynthesis protein YwqC n=1 Tax=Brevibacillus parabrevis TaxID=54914 RepID=A0A4Y3PP52_BREPA|nr:MULTISPECIES: Wzz/FepE/Etk N-terminal domain-containing protein [Brevibacillus]MBU8714427.1 capsular biosynthesis protein [Brevibacillus parabrevis]MDH6351353.1 capsular polysaccharide biosynthesis protein [Brevibacillus sp. 1238]MDR4998732.1 Wzz/FepE/Etk N-terminal domain-containing protein [Brevibacillus parabrevis]MED1723591.1 Wzz/FepE/Etk N-terminal domain-containing protein [Brevibacillus parabrevis]MED2254865.1 Wzz/FepE/Etk N-terminal domain-containing protein [Brevibacillus parabrevi
MNETVNLREILLVLSKRWGVILAITSIFTIGTALISFFALTPIYQAKTEILVNRSLDSNLEGVLSVAEIDSNLKLIETYRVIIESPRIMERVVQTLGPEASMDELLLHTKVEPVKDSQVISITVEDPDQKRAVLIANTIATTFQEEVVKMLSMNNVHILAEARDNPAAKPVSPKPLLNSIIGFVLGLATSVGVVFFMEHLDTRLRSEKEVEEYLGLPVLATIAVIDKKTKKHLRQKRAEEVRSEYEKAEA